MKNVIIYARVSSVTDRQSTDSQIDKVMRFVEEHHLNVIKVFEEHISGAKTREERPILNECLNFFLDNKDKVDTLLVSELSRLGRNITDVQENVNWCIKKHLNVHFIKEKLSVFNDDGSKHLFLEVFISILSTIADMERDNIRYRLNNGRELAKKRGVKMGRKQGYIKDDDAILNDFPEVVKLLKQGKLTIRQICACAKGKQKKDGTFGKASIGSVMKIKAILKERNELKA